jgi:nucleoside-diphosphate-sugar epimerase
MTDRPAFLSHLLVFGLGYTGGAVAAAAVAAGWRVSATSRAPARGAPAAGVRLLDFAQAGPALADVTHVLATPPPREDAGDPVLAAHGRALAAAPALRWAGYLSATGVYGDRGGGWVDEATPPAPTQERGRRRLAAERAWAALAGHLAVDLFRLGGIYGPGRSPFDDLRAGRARRIVRPGQWFSRIHRDDVVRAVLAALAEPRPPGVRVLNLVDDEPAESAAVIEEAARLLGMVPPPALSFEAAAPGMSAMARSFWSENRRVAGARTRQALGLAWRYPTYREGLRAILAEEGRDGAPE